MYLGIQLFVFLPELTIEGVFIYINDSISGFMTTPSFSLESCLTAANTKIASGVVRTMIDGRWGGV